MKKQNVFQEIVQHVAKFGPECNPQSHKFLHELHSSFPITFHFIPTFHSQTNIPHLHIFTLPHFFYQEALLWCSFSSLRRFSSQIELSAADLLLGKKIEFPSGLVTADAGTILKTGFKKEQLSNPEKTNIKKTKSNHQIIIKTNLVKLPFEIILSKTKETEEQQKKMHLRRKPKQMNSAMSAFKDMLKKELQQQNLMFEAQNPSSPSPISPVMNPFVIGKATDSVSEHRKTLELKFRPKEIKIDENDLFLPQSAALLLASMKSPSAVGLEWEMNFLANVDSNKTRLNDDFQESQRRCNTKKNRYQNVLANDSSRVMLEAKKYDIESNRLISGYDYINANFVPLDLFRLQKESPKQVQTQNEEMKKNLFGLFFDPSFQEVFQYSTNPQSTTNKNIVIPSESCCHDYIATQAPIRATVLDFWEMIIEQDCYLLVSLTQDQGLSTFQFPQIQTPLSAKPMQFPTDASPMSFEDKIWSQKIATSATQGYWPKDKQTPIFISIPEGSELRNEEFLTKFFTKNQKNPQIENEFGFKIELLDERDFIDELSVYRRLKITHCPSGLEKEVSSLQFLGWPDMEAPENAQIFAKFMKRLDAVSMIHKILGTDSENPHILVHCNAGIGRTGSLLASHVVFHEYYQFLQKKNQEDQQNFLFNIVECVYKLKNQRSGMVQNSKQLFFIYQAVEAMIGMISKQEEDEIMKENTCSNSNSKQ